MAERARPAPLIGVVDPAGRETPFGSYAAVASTGQSLLAAELSQRLGAMGAAVLRLEPKAPEAAAFHWGRWYAAGMRAGAGEVDAIGYAGAGAVALLEDAGLDDLLSPIAGEVVANNRYSADAFCVAGDVGAVLRTLEAADSDNAAVRRLEDSGFTSRDLRGVPWSRFDVDTPLDLALLRLATRLPANRHLDEQVAGFLEMATLPGGGRLEVPHLEALGDVIRDRSAELVVAGRVPASTLAHLETETACRVRAFVEERGMRSARDARPRSLLADWIQRLGPADLVRELASLGDAARVGTPWLRELTEAAAQASVPVLLGGHALVSDGLRIVVDAAWLGR